MARSLSSFVVGMITGGGLLLAGHASGRRSGDQFCVYVCDRLVIPALTQDQLAKIGAGELPLDAMTKDCIRRRLTCRFVEMESGPEALELERRIQRVGLSIGRPFWNGITE